MAISKCDILVFMNAPSPYWRDFAQYIGEYYSIEFIFYSSCSDLGRPNYWDGPLPDNCTIVSDGVLKFGGYFFDSHVIRRIRKRNPKVVISQGTNLISALFALQYCRLTKRHFSIWNEIWRTKNGEPREKFSFLYSCLFRKSNSFFSSSRAGVDFWSKKYNRNVKEYFVPGSVDRYLSHTKTLNKRLNLFFGHRLVEQYNPIGALKIAQKVSEVIPVSLAVNGSGSLRPLVEKFIDEQALDFVKFIDINKLEDLDNYYRQAHISISPCFYSQGNLGTNDALASGCPIIISEGVRYHDLQIEAASLGIILPLNYSIFAEEIIKLYNDKKRYLNMSKEAKEYAFSNLSNTATLKKYDLIFADIGVDRKTSTQTQKGNSK